ncbi:MAG: ABC transporter ATP-binding protein [Gemmatimonadales bacterium]|nr:MAG: ABC transporter ATP-binding protein [Gemmatimonadales bacterium]
MSSLLRVADLTVSFPDRHGRAPVVQGVQLSLEAGEILALVGESGSGKTVTALSLVRLLPPGATVAPESVVEIGGIRVLGPGATPARHLRGGTVGVVFQEGSGALNPVRRIGEQLREVVVRHRGVAGAEAGREVVRLLEEVGLPEPSRVASSFPHQLSGGMRQRVLIALALAGDPRLLVADEPTSALDARVQLRILALIRELTRTRGLGTLLITHDLGVVAHTSDRVAVMYAGRVLEEGRADQLLRSPGHPYTRGLLAALPSGRQRKAPLASMPGRMPPPGLRGAGCVFRDRCSQERPRCREEPDWVSLGETGGRVRCWLALEAEG